MSLLTIECEYIVSNAPMQLLHSFLASISNTRFCNILMCVEIQILNCQEAACMNLSDYSRMHEVQIASIKTATNIYIESNYKA